jgi:hypothetical protein
MFEHLHSLQTDTWQRGSDTATAPLMDFCVTPEVYYLQLFSDSHFLTTATVAGHRELRSRMIIKIITLNLPVGRQMLPSHKAFCQITLTLYPGS